MTLFARMETKVSDPFFCLIFPGRDVAAGWGHFLTRKACGEHRPQSTENVEPRSPRTRFLLFFDFVPQPFRCSNKFAYHPLRLAQFSHHLIYIYRLLFSLSAAFCFLPGHVSSLPSRMFVPTSLTILFSLCPFFSLRSYLSCCYYLSPLLLSEFSREPLECFLH